MFVPVALALSINSLQQEPYLWTRGALVIIDDMGPEDILALDKARNEDELKIVLSSLPVEHRIVDGRYFIWPKSLFDIGASERMLEVWRKFPGSPSIIGKEVKLKDYWSFVEEKHRHVYEVSGWTDKTKGFNDARGTITFVRFVTITSPEGKQMRIGMPNEMLDRIKSLPSLPNLRKRGEKWPEVDFKMPKVIREMKFLRYGGSLNGVAGLELQSEFTKFMIEEMDRLDKEFVEERLRIAEDLKRLEPRFASPKVVKDLSVADIDWIRAKLADEKNVKTDDLESWSVAEVSYVPALNVRFAYEQPGTYHSVFLEFDSLRPQKRLDRRKPAP